DDASGDLDAFGFVHGDKGTGAALALAKRDHDAALAGLVFGKTTVDTIFGKVRRADMAAEVCAVDLDFAVQLVVGNLSGQSLAQLVSQNERRLILDVQIAAELQGAEALNGVDEDADGSDQINERHLARGEDRPAGDAELAVA